MALAVCTIVGISLASGACAFLLPPTFLPPVRRVPFLAMATTWIRQKLSSAASNTFGVRAGSALAIAGIALGLLLRSPLMAVSLGVGATFMPGWLQRRQRAAWRRQVLLELGDAVEYLELHFAAGATVPDAIAGTAAFLVGPLAGELRRVLARAALLQDGSRALDELAQRLADPDLTAVARRLSAAWRLRAPGPDTFAGFGDTLRHIRETHIAARTKTLPVAYVAIAGWMLFALVAIIAVPAGTAFLHSLSSF